MRIDSDAHLITKPEKLVNLMMRLPDLLTSGMGPRSLSAQTVLHSNVT